MIHKHSGLCWYTAWHLIKLNVPGQITPLVFNQCNLQCFLRLPASLVVCLELCASLSPASSGRKTSVLQGREISAWEAHHVLLYQRYLICLALLLQNCTKTSMYFSSKVCIRTAYWGVEVGCGEGEGGGGWAAPQHPQQWDRFVCKLSS